MLKYHAEYEKQLKRLQEEEEEKEIRSQRERESVRDRQTDRQRERCYVLFNPVILVFSDLSELVQCTLPVIYSFIFLGCLK